MTTKRDKKQTAISRNLMSSENVLRVFPALTCRGGQNRLIISISNTIINNTRIISVFHTQLQNYFCSFLYVVSILSVASSLSGILMYTFKMYIFYQLQNLCGSHLSNPPALFSLFYGQTYTLEFDISNPFLFLPIITLQQYSGRNLSHLLMQLS